MELDDFKIKAKAQGQTGDETLPVSQPGLNDLIEDLKAADSKAKKTILGSGTIIAMLLIIYISIAATRVGAIANSYRFLAGGFCLILFYFFWLYQMLRKVDYTLPVATFLRKARRRHSFMNPSDWFIVVPLLAILGAGGGMIVYHSFLKYFNDVTIPMVFYIIFFISVVIFGFWASRKNWKKDKGELLQKISEMIKDLEA